MTERTVTMTLRHPLQTYTWNEDGQQKGPVVQPGVVITIPLEPGMSRVMHNPYGDAYHTAILRSGAKVPCEHLGSDGDGDEYRSWEWFTCARFDLNSTMPLVCLGDKCRCPSSTVRQEATSQQEGREKRE